MTSVPLPLIWTWRSPSQTRLSGRRWRDAAGSKHCRLHHSYFCHWHDESAERECQIEQSGHHIWGNLGHQWGQKQHPETQLFNSSHHLPLTTQHLQCKWSNYNGLCIKFTDFTKSECGQAQQPHLGSKDVGSWGRRDNAWAQKTKPRLGKHSTRSSISLNFINIGFFFNLGHHEQIRKTYLWDPWVHS